MYISYYFTRGTFCLAWLAICHALACLVGRLCACQLAQLHSLLACHAQHALCGCGVDVYKWDENPQNKVLISIDLVYYNYLIGRSWNNKSIKSKNGQC